MAGFITILKTGAAYISPVRETMRCAISPVISSGHEPPSIPLFASPGLETIFIASE